jgi:hypothetical protein
MKLNKNKFDLTVVILLISIVTIVAALTVGIYFGIKINNEDNIVLHKNKNILDSIDKVCESNEEIYYDNRGLNILDQKLFEEELLIALEDPIVITYLLPNEINADTIYLYNKDDETNTTLFTTLIYYSSSDTSSAITNLTNKSTQKTSHDIKINFPDYFIIEGSGRTINIGSGYIPGIDGKIIIFDKDNNQITTLYNFVEYEIIQGSSNLNVYISGSYFNITNYGTGEYIIKTYLKGFINVEPFNFTFKCISEYTHP